MIRLTIIRPPTFTRIDVLLEPLGCALAVADVQLLGERVAPEIVGKRMPAPAASELRRRSAISLFSSCVVALGRSSNHSGTPSRKVILSVTEPESSPIALLRSCGRLHLTAPA